MNSKFDFLTWCEIDLDALKHNLKWVKNKVGEEVKICFAGTKADGYGYGIKEIAEASIEAEVDYLGVAVPDEGIFLRENNINIPIIVFGNILPEMADKIVDYDLTQTVCTFDVCERLSYYAFRKKKIVKVHIKVDTGMGRIGVPPDEVVDFVLKISGVRNIHIEGIYSHLSSAGRDEQYTQKQISLFSDVISELKKRGIDIPIKHLANSAAIKRYPETYMDMVRPGSVVFNADLPELKNVFSLKSKVVFIKSVPKGTRIGYRGSYMTKRDTKIATIPCGYVDGYPFLLGNEKWKVIIKDKFVPVVGRVCMDQIMVDVGQEEINIGDDVIIFGKGKKCQISVNEMFNRVDFFNFLAPSVNKRVARVYLKDKSIWKIKTLLDQEGKWMR